MDPRSLRTSLSEAFDLAQMKTLALGGAVGGLVAFLFVNPLAAGERPFLPSGAAARDWLHVGPIFGSNDRPDNRGKPDSSRRVAHPTA